MKLLPLIFATSVLSQSAIIFNNKRKDRNIRYSKYRCICDLDDISWGIKADEDVIVDFYPNTDCRGHWKRRAWGRTNFRDFVYYGSIRLSRRERRYYGGQGFSGGNGNEEGGSENFD